VIDQHPLAYLLSVEGRALEQAFRGEHDRAFTEARIAETARLLAAAERMGTGGPAVALTVEEGYRTWAESYDEPGNGLVDVESAIVHRLLDRLPPGRALDAACGTGRHAAHLASRGHEVVGVDGSPDMLARAAAKLPDADLRRGELDALPLPDDHVDLVVCALALTHVPDLRPVFAEFARVLRPGGHLVTSDSRTGLPVIRRTPEGTWGHLPHHDHLASDYLAAALGHGFRVVDCREPHRPAPAASTRSRPEPDPDPADLPPPADGVPPDIWALHAWCPEASAAAWTERPVAIIWHFRLEPPTAIRGPDRPSEPAATAEA
jgi:ubiquinone/menaquinone biosynthesis C-methylase UbiE